MHYSSRAMTTMLVIALILAVIAIFRLPRAEKTRHRVLGSAFLAGIVATVVVYWAYGARHAALTHADHGHHPPSISATLWAGWIVITAIGAVPIFLVAAWRASAYRRRLRNRAAADAQRQAAATQQAADLARAQRRAARVSRGES